MPNKYIYDGAAYCGLGDGPLEATLIAHQGATGYAWNNKNILTGTAPGYGSVDAGDTVFIRGKTAAGADLAFSYGTTLSLGKSGLTAAQNVEWIFDNGTTWPGVTGGSMTFNPTSNVGNNILGNNRVACLDQDAIKQYARAASWSTPGLVGINNGAEIDGWLVDNSAVTQYGTFIQQLGGTIAFAKNIHVIANLRFLPIFSSTPYGGLYVINPTIELTNSTQNYPVFGQGGLGSYIKVIGGTVSGAGAISNTPLANVSATGSAAVELIGLQYPLVMPIPDITIVGATVSSIGADGAMGSAFADYCGMTDSREFMNLPTLNARTPGASPVPWSIAISPKAVTSPSRALKAPIISKMWESAAGVATLDLHFRVSTAFTGLDKSNVYAEVTYVDNATGLSKTFSTRASGSLTASGASWSVPTYWTSSFNDKKLVIETPTAVKQYAPIFVQFIVAAPAVDTTRFLILCPDLQSV